MYSSSRPTRRIMPRNQVQHKAHIKLCTERDVTLFKDPDQVLQWVATARNNSAMNPNVVSPIPLMNNTGFGDNYPKLYGAGAHGIPSDLSLVSGNGFQYGTDISTAVAPANVYVHPDPVSSEDGSTAGLRYDVPDSVDMAYTRSSQSVAFTNDYSSSSAVACSAGPYSQVSFSTSTAWSSPSSAAIDPPFPHSYATHGFFPCSMASPQMLPASEDFGTNFLGFDYILPTSMAETQVQSPTDYQSSEILYSGTIRPTRDQTRASIAENTFWSTPEMSPDMIVLPITGAQGSARPSKHGSANVNARNHHLYHLGVNPLDGLYYCPFGSPDGCRHKPEKLKCNYEYVILAYIPISRIFTNISQQACGLSPQAIPLQVQCVFFRTILIDCLSPPTRKRSTWDAWTRQ